MTEVFVKIGMILDIVRLGIVAFTSTIGPITKPAGNSRKILKERKDKDGKKSIIPMLRKKRK